MLAKVQVSTTLTLLLGIKRRELFTPYRALTSMEFLIQTHRHPDKATIRNPVPVRMAISIE